MKAYQDASLAPVRRAKALLEEMTLAEKIGQLNQRLYGFRIYERKCVNGEDTIELSEEFCQEVENTAVWEFCTVYIVQIPGRIRITKPV